MTAFVALIKRFYVYIVAVFRGTSSARPVDQPQPIEPPPFVTAEPAPTPPVEPPQPIVVPFGGDRRAKWVKPKGAVPPAAKPKPAEPRKPAAPKAERKPKPPKVREDDPEQWGRFYFRDTILDQLDTYFIYLRRMKVGDRDAYGLLRKLGIQVMPESAVKSFDRWRSEEETQELSAWFLKTRPGFGAVAYGIDPGGTSLESGPGVVDMSPEQTRRHSVGLKNEEVERARGRVMVLTKSGRTATFNGEPIGIFWVPKFLYFTKLSHPSPDIERVSNSDIYLMTVFWDRTDGKAKHYRKRKGGVPQMYAVSVDNDTGAIKVLRTMIREDVTIRHKHGPDRGHTFTIPTRRWAVPLDYMTWATDSQDEHAPEEYLRRLFVEAALMYENASMGSMIRIEVTKKDLTAVFGVEIKRTAYFFKDRDVVLNDRGSKARIFHIVRPHARATKAGETTVPMHFRGLRQFMWAGYSVRITVPGKDHFHLPEFDVGMRLVDANKIKSSDGITTDEIADKLVGYMRDGLGVRK